MGAMTFFEEVRTREPLNVAFRIALSDACWNHGHAGYSGTLAEKNDVVEIELPPGKDPILYAEELIEAQDPRIDDKWGPAGALKTQEGWLFFGWASS